MELSKAKKKINDRRTYVRKAYDNKGETAVSVLVASLAKKFNVTEITIYGDLKATKATGETK